MEDLIEESLQAPPFPYELEENDLNLCESYLISGMFEEATSMSSSILKRCLDNPELIASSLKQHSVSYEGGEGGGGQDIVEENCSDEYQFLADIIESAAMVFIQSLKELGRTTEIFRELEAIFQSVDAIPIDVLLIGGHLQIKEGCGTVLKPVLDLFFTVWRFDDEIPHLQLNSKTSTSSLGSSVRHRVSSKEKYLELVEFYVVQLLGIFLGDFELAISWTEKAEIPEDKRHELIRKLQSLCSGRNSGSSQEENEIVRTNISAPSRSEVLKESLKTQDHTDQRNSKLSITRAVHTYSWLSCIFHLKGGNMSSLIQCGKLFLRSTFIILAFYILYRKRSALKRFADRQSHFLKKAILDIWQLAFSVQTNPLAAVQPLPSSAVGLR